MRTVAAEQEFHEDLAVKNKEMERLAAAAAVGGGVAGRPLPGDADAVATRVAILHHKWRTVWRLSVDCKKLLQDTLDHLLEVSGGRAKQLARCSTGMGAESDVR